jgi:hypothetical protein
MSDREILALPGIGAVRLEQIKRGTERWIEHELKALVAGELRSAPGALPGLERHPLDVAIDALRQAADRVPDDGWRACLDGMADTLPDREWRERHWGED